MAGGGGVNAYPSEKRVIGGERDVLGERFPSVL